MQNKITRRRFVGNTAAAMGAGFWVSSQTDVGLSASPNERVHIACIGVGGKGSSDCDDAVTVSTADHTHAAASVRAIRLGKQVYCQKPLTHSVSEARLMRETARKHKVVTQMGNQGTAHDGFRTGVEMIRSGAIGDVQEVHVWTNRPYSDWKAGKMYWKQLPQVVGLPIPSIWLGALIPSLVESPAIRTGI